ncbi:MFS transporter [Gordonia sp. KTR9]|uniref:MFS transporter n=1 Tax=Gordonia sp. KTR9 TaxID=337191 RepID=UPI00027DE116|nr:MFS transporter [Gordonia sp. KTR9]AFR50712.1 Permease, MFS superfamily [Gordonia sp. KTR9]
MSRVRGATPGLTRDAAEAVDKAPAGAVGSVVVLCFGGLVASLMQTLIIPIQPDLPRLLGTSIGNASWIITATLLAAAVAMPIAGRLGDMFGKQRVLFVSAVLLTLGSLICALGDTLVPLIIGRGVQGLAMGFIPVGMSLIREITPPRITSMAVAAMSATLGVGGAIGLPLAAWIVQTWDWHALFYVATGLGVLISVAVLVLVPRVNDAVGGRIDVPGAIGLAVGLSAFLIAVSKANDWGWTSGRTLGLGLGGIAVLLVWGVFELRQRDPLVDLRTTARPAVLLTNIAAAAIGFGMMAQSIVLPMLLRLPEATGYGLGQSLLAAGLWMAPGGLMMMIFAPVSGILINRIGAKITLAIGAAILGCGYLLAFFLMDAAWKLMLASIVCAIGVGVGYAAMPTLIMGSVPATEAGAAVGLNGLMRSLGTTIASAVMALILASATISLGGTEVPDESTFTWCFLVAAAAAFVGMAITLTIPARRGSSNVPEEQPLPARH